jgi:Sulfotransferase domain
LATRPFDFLVIGAARCGTTSLWRALVSHPQIRVPSDKEREFFSSDERYARGLDAYLERTFPNLGDETIGTVTPQLMQPEPRALETIVSRIGATCPEVKLVAMLRDPIERGVSQFRRTKKVTQRHRDEDFDGFIERLTEKRGRMDKIPLVRASDYGRILRFYFEAFDREQIRVFFTQDLDREPATLYRQLFEFLGVEPDHSPGEPRVHVGGVSTRASQSALDELLAELDRLGLFPDHDENVRRGFAWWLRHLWNCEPDQVGTEISTELRRRLAKRYLKDARTLEELLGETPPWAGALRAAAKAPRP